MSRDNVVLCGGGLDTMATLAHLSMELKAQDEHFLFCHLTNSKGEMPFVLCVVDYGQVAFEQEYAAVRTAAEALFPDKAVNVIHDSSIRDWNPDGGLLFGTGTNSELSGRNLALLLSALKQGPVNSVTLCLTGEVDIPMPQDTTTNFVKHADHLLRMSNMSNRVVAPLLSIEKSNALRAAHKHWPGLFNVAFSCWLPRNGKPCGTCRHCTRFDYFRGAVEGSAYAL